MRRTLLTILFAMMMASIFSPSPMAVVAAESAAAWKTEFDAVCGQSDNAAEMSVADLKKAVARCDALKPQIEALDATPRKVYLKRLQMCRNLFTYLLESKAKDNK
jgi:hypothetical protein